MNKPESEMVLVTAEDANNYCRILTLLGMEEEGDPVAEVERLVSAASKAVHSEQPIAEQPKSEQPDSVYLGSAGPSEDLQTARPEEEPHHPFRVMAQGKHDYTLQAFPVGSHEFGMMLTIAAEEGAIYVTKAQAMAFFGLTDRAACEAVSGEVPSDKKYLPSMTPPAASLPDSAPAGQEDARDAKRYRWLRDKSEPGICAFYLSVGDAFKGVRFTRATVDEAIDAQIDALTNTEGAKP